MKVPATITVAARKLNKAVQLTAWLNAKPDWFELSDDAHDEISGERDNLLPDFMKYFDEEEFATFRLTVEEGKLYLELYSDETIMHKIEYVPRR